MSDDRMNLELGVSVHTEGAEKLSDLDKLLLKIKTAQDKLNSTLGQGNSKAVQSAKASLDFDRDRLRVLKMQLGFESKARRDGQRETERAARDAARDVTARLREEQRAIRELGRLRRQEAAAALAAEREVTRERSRAVQRVGSGLSRAGGGARRLAGVAAVGTAAAAAVTQRATDAITRSGLAIDDALTQAQIHIYGEQDASKSRKSAEALRKRLMPVATKLGTRTAELMGAYVEAAQAGVSDDLLDITVEQGSKFAKMNKLAVPDVLEQSGYALQGLKAFGKVTADVVKRYFDESSYLIATTSANRKELLSFTRTGLASGASVGMNMEETLAFGGAVTAAGGEGQQASRMLSTQGTRIADWRNKGTNILRKHHRDANDRQFLDAVQILGYRDSDSMADSFSKDFFGSLVNAQDKLKGISDPLKRKSITAQLFGQEFGSLIDSMIMGGNMRDFRGKLDDAGGYLNKSWSKFTGNMGFVLDKIGVVLGNLTETMGLALKPLWTEVSEFVDRFKGFDRAGEAVRSFTDGILAGFGADSVTTLLTRMIGDPAQFQLNLRTFFLAGKGLAEGLKSVATGIKNLFSAFSGGSADAQYVGRLTGQILALSAALTVAAPALVVLGSLTAILRGLGAAGAGVAGLLGGGARAAGAAGTAAGAGAMGAAVLSKAGQVIGLAFLAEVAQHFNVLKMDPNKGLVGNLLEELVPAPLRRWLDSDKGSTPGQGGGWQDVGESKRLEEMRKSLDRNTAETKRNTESTRDAAKQATETKAAEIKAEEARKLTELVGIRNAATGSIGGGGPSTAEQLRSRGFNVIGDGGSNAGTGGGMPQADAGDTRSGGTRSWRNRNPGNLKDGPFARRMGAIGRDAGGFAVFPDEATGRKAQAALLFDNERYKNLSIRDAIARYAPGSDGNDPASYAAQMARAAGVGVDTRLSDLTPAQREKFLDAQRDKEGWRAGTTTGGSGGSSGGVAGTTDGRSVPRMTGTLTMDGQTYQYGSGGHRGANSIPAGVYPVTPNAIGPWGRQHGAIGINNNRIWDAQLGRFRDGIEMHSASSASMLSAGCLAINKQQWAQFRAQTLDFVKRNGRAWLKVDSNGNASITADRPDDPTAKAQGEAAKTKSLADNISKPAVPKPGLGDLDVTPPSAKGGQPGGVLSVPTAPTAPRNITSGVPNGGGGRRNGSAGGGPVNIHIGTVNAKDGKDAGEQIGEKVRSAINSHYGDVDGYGYA